MRFIDDEKFEMAVDLLQLFARFMGDREPADGEPTLKEFMTWLDDQVTAEVNRKGTSA